MKKIFKININVFMTRLMAVFLLSSVMIFSCGFSVLKPQKYTFVRVGELKSKSDVNQSILLNNGKVLFLKSTDKNEIFDPETNKCRFIKDKKILKYVYSTTLLGNGNVLIAAGIDYKKSTIFDYKKELFITVDAGVNYPKAKYSTVLLKNGNVLITGGTSSDKNSYKTAKSAEIYNPHTEKFTLINDMNIARQDHKMILLNNGEVLILGGGYDLSGENSTWKRVYNAEIYNPNTNKFTVIDELKMYNAKIYNGGTRKNEIKDEIKINPDYVSVLKNGKVVIVDIGQDCYDWSILNIIEFDPETNTFNKVNQIRLQKIDYGIGFLDDGRILTVGGRNHISLGEKRYKSAELINPYTGEIKKISNIGETMLYPEVIRLKNGDFLIVKDLKVDTKQTKKMYEFITN